MSVKLVTLTLNPAVDVSTSVERIEAEVKMRCGEAHRDPGGGGINVARVLLRMGADVTALYPAGGVTGRLLQELVEREGIEDVVIPVTGETRESFTAFERQTGNEFRFVLAGPELDKAAWTATRNALEAMNGVLFVVASGSLPPGAPEEAYAEIAHVTRKLGARLAVDTSGVALAAALRERPYLIKPNLREMRELTGLPIQTDEETLDAARRLVGEKKADVVAVTLGADGAMLVCEEGSWRGRAPEITPVSSVGAGDSFLAMLIHALASGQGMSEALRAGMAGGTAALLSPGTELCRRDDVERLLPQISIEEL
ncbi:1-phosphofructokinase family hexose kinase [Parvibaculum sp.]|jgi:6-phosphofructokinase 2|uniref:1-phosphofructokinase family hexose kinase n=1 Tax=Parvibaculum sp. TaxID=2024848 RepID=UPI000C452A53|nr:1-phosphofructokinase family hexose kinase [Parvibaculum sp.]MAM95416.1 phosphofructokinase [Parvibaculum sp.]HCX67749.1 phosphofructokinase [Rhodobiaceae bacterium]|tara:strand:+ start:8593 stop:9531 length:939 start_codon:yes stop_codon:yes gene_type:complete